MSSGIITGMLQSSSYGTSNTSLTGVTGAADSVKECVHPSPCYAILGVLFSMDSSFNTKGSGMSLFLLIFLLFELTVHSSFCCGRSACEIPHDIAVLGAVQICAGLQIVRTVQLIEFHFDLLSP
jgi:hypothetical protein